MTLHTVNLLPDHPDCQRCISQLASGDAVVFLGHGAWISSVQSAWHKQWQRSGVTLHVLEDDLAARGLTGDCAPAVTPIDHSGLVTLTEQHSRQRAWF